MDKKPIYSTRMKAMLEMIDNPKTPLQKAMVEALRITESNNKKK